MNCYRIKGSKSSYYLKNIILSIISFTIIIPITGCFKENHNVHNQEKIIKFNNNKSSVESYSLITRSKQHIYLTLLSSADNEYLPKKNVRSDGSVY